MSLPDTVIEGRDLAPSQAAPTDIGVAHVVLLTDRGPVVPTDVTGLQDLVNKFGPKQTWSGHYDGADVFFRERGYRLRVSRAVGPAATYASTDLLDAAAAASLHVVDKVGPGVSGVTLDLIDNATDAVLVPVAGHFHIKVRYNGDVVEDSGDLATRADAVAWSAGSRYTALTLGVSTNVPAPVSAKALTAGVDDHASVTTTQLQAALDRFDIDLGPGQVAIPGYTTDVVHDMLAAHGKTNNRVPVYDLPDTANDATLRASAAHIRSLKQSASDLGGSDKGGCFVPWDTCGGAGGTVRVVPTSWRQMATMARNDADGLSPNQPAAGKYGAAEYVTGLSQPAWTKAQRQALNEAGVNVSILKYGRVMTYGFRTPVDQVVDKKWSMLSNARLEMAVRALFKVEEDAFQFSELDGFRRNIARFVSALDGVLLRFQQIGSLKGATPYESYRVTGDVNTDTTMSNGELRAEAVIRISPFNERTIIGLARVPSEEAI